MDWDAFVFPAVFAVVGSVFGARACYRLGRRHEHARANLPPADVPVSCAAWNCGGRQDPRCAGGNCTRHCESVLGCRGRCLDVWRERQRTAHPGPGGPHLTLVPGEKP